MNKRKANLEKQMYAIRKELSAIEEADNEARFSGLIGRCFSYRNCYSCPKTDKDYWLTYCRVNSISGSYANVMEFQIDSTGRITMEPDTCMQAAMLGASWTQISPAAFNKALKHCRKAVEKLLA